MPDNKKKAAAETKNIPVFSRSFLKMLHDNNFETDHDFQVSCNVDGKLGDFPDLDAANKFAAEHRRTHPGHRLSVTTVQTSKDQ